MPLILARVAAWTGKRRGLLLLFAVALAVRLVLAYVSEGLWFDMTLFRLWSNRLAEEGPWGFYSPTTGYVVDYPPGYLYVLLILGKVSHAVFGSTPNAVLKLPAIAADLGVAALAMLMAPRALAAQRGPVRALAAASVLLNPALILVSAVWGQVDALLALLVLATVYVLTGPSTLTREIVAIVLLAVTAATKPQVVFVLPMIAVFLLWRHRSESWMLQVARGAVLTATGAATIIVMFRPFGVGPVGIVAFYRNAGSLYEFTSLWAFNFWGAVGFYLPDTGAGALRIGGIAAFHLGLAATAIMTAVLMHRAWVSLARGVTAPSVVLFGAVAMTCVAFSLLTRTHERYLYLAITALAPFTADRRFRALFVVLSVCFLMNVHFVYVFHSHHSLPPGNAWTIQPLYDLLFGQADNAVQRKLLSIFTALACLASALFGWNWLNSGAVAPERATLAIGRRVPRGSPI